METENEIINPTPLFFNEATFHDSFSACFPNDYT